MEMTFATSAVLFRINGPLTKLVVIFLHQLALQKTIIICQFIIKN